MAYDLISAVNDFDSLYRSVEEEVYTVFKIIVDLF